MLESAPLPDTPPSPMPVSPSGAQLSIYLHAVFDTGCVIDTYTLTAEHFQRYGAQVRDLLTSSVPDVTWSQEYAERTDQYDPLPESYPVLDLSFVMASSPTLLQTTELQFVDAMGATRTLTLSQARVFYHAFKCGVFSFVATPASGEQWTLADWQAAEARLMSRLPEIIGSRLTAMNAAVGRAIIQARVPLYQSEFLGITTGDTKHPLFDWSHRVFVADLKPSDVQAAASFLAPLMKPIDQDGVQNMALTPGWFIYLGSGRSIICSARNTDDDLLERQRARTVATYIRMVEVRQHVWRALYDVDRSLRNANALIRSTTEPGAARKLVGELRDLDFRVTGMLEELDPYKLTFDSESIWLMRQLDRNWLTADLVSSLRGRLATLNRAYEYHEETISRDREARLRAILNLIGFVATAGSVAQIIGYFDPQNNQLDIITRASLLVAGVAVIILIFVILLAVNLRRRRE